MTIRDEVALIIDPESIKGRESYAALPGFVSPEAAQKAADYQFGKAIKEAYAKADAILALSPPEPISPDLLAVLKAVEQRLNESGTGEMGLLDTIHAVYALVKPAIAKAESRAMPLQDHGNGIYIASRASIPERSAMWRRFRDIDGIKITSSWIDEAGEGETADFGELWARIFNEIRTCRRLVLYAEPDDFPLKGALIEAGMALGLRKPVTVCMPGVVLNGRTHRPVGSWLAARSVERCDDIRAAMVAEDGTK